MLQLALTNFRLGVPILIQLAQHLNTHLYCGVYFLSWVKLHIFVITIYFAIFCM